MTRNKTKIILPLLQAYAEEKTLQVRGTRPETNWVDATELDIDLMFTSNNVEWRVKPEPREWWLVASKHLQTEPWKVFHRQPTIEDIALNNYEVIHVREVLE